MTVATLVSLFVGFKTFWYSKEYSRGLFLVRASFFSKLPMRKHDLEYKGGKGAVAVLLSNFSMGGR
jgi:hypothetical protein